MTSLFYCYLRAINAFHPSSPTFTSKNSGVGGWGKDLRHLFHLCNEVGRSLGDQALKYQKNIGTISRNGPGFVFLYFKAWSPMTSLLHCYLRETNAFQLPIKPHFTSKKWTGGRGKGLAPSIPPFFLHKWSQIFVFGVFLGLVSNDLPILLLFACNQRISPIKPHIHLKKSGVGGWGKDLRHLFHLCNEVGRSLGDQALKYQKTLEPFLETVPALFFLYFKAWSPMTSLLHCYLHETNAFQLPIKPHFTSKKWTGGGGKDLRHLFPSFPGFGPKNSKDTSLRVRICEKVFSLPMIWSF